MSNINLAKSRERHREAFFFALLAAAVVFVPFMVYDNGYFLFFGDFNVQQVPFYKHCHEAIRTGHIFWDFKTDLGANFIGSYSFYTITSPFFWLTLPFPNSWVPYFMGPLLILKFATASLFAYMYLSRFVKNKEFAVIGGLLYAFSGFSVYNVFFNHFHEAIVFFPLLLWALEVFMAENRRGYLALMVFATALINYFFFVAMVVFVVLYWFLRMLSGAWSLTPKRMGALAFEVGVGFLLAMVVLWPSIIVAAANPRTGGFIDGWNAFIYYNKQIFYNAFQVFFFPPDLPARPVFFPDADVKWASLGGWLPLFGMTGFFAFMSTKKKHWLRNTLIILFVAAGVPVLNSAFMLFNPAYYARWFFILTLMLSLCTILALENKKAKWGRALGWSGGITLAITLIIGLYPNGKNSDGTIKRWGLFTEQNSWNESTLRFWVTCGFALVSVVALWLLLPMLKRQPRRFAASATASVMIVAAAYSMFFIGMGKNNSYKTKEYIIPDFLDSYNSFELGDRDTFRVDVYDGMDNSAMFWDFSTIQAFQSIVPASVTEFYPYVGVERGVGSRPEVSHYGLRSLLSVKYLMNSTELDRESFMDGDTPRMQGYTYLNEQNNHRVYENENYIPYGFTYEYYMDKPTCENYGEDNRELMMLKALLLDDKDAAKYRDVLKPFPTMQESHDDDPEPEEGEETDYTPDNDYYYVDTSYDAFVADCAARKATACTSFVTDARGFTAKTGSDHQANLVFFSIPYEKGWSITVDGQKAELIKANIGFMSVFVPGGAHEIRFHYMTPGLELGALVTLASGLALGAYLLLWHKVYRRRAVAPAYAEPESKDAAIQTFDEIESEEAVRRALERMADWQEAEAEVAAEQPACEPVDSQGEAIASPEEQTDTPTEPFDDSTSHSDTEE